MKPASHRVIVNERCCATCTHLHKLYWTCGRTSDNGVSSKDRAEDRIRVPSSETCDEWERRDGLEPASLTGGLVGCDPRPLRDVAGDHASAAAETADARLGMDQLKGLQ